MLLALRPRTILVPLSHALLLVPNTYSKMLTDAAEEVSEQVGVYVRVDSFEGADGTLSVQELVTTTWTYKLLHAVSV